MNNNPGFMITRLALTGPNKETAELTFRAGLNVITGPSDTGKTFAFQCIDFLLGSSTPPKAIPEAEGYDTIFLDIHVYDTGNNLTLKRSLKGGQLKLISPDGQQKTLKQKHKGGDENTVSSFLLSLSNLQDKEIRKNIRGVKRSFSFRDIAHLSIISEENIIKEGSPILSGQYTKETEEKSVFQFLLSGQDDSSIIPVDDSGEIKKRFSAQEDLLNELIGRVKQKIDDCKIEEDLEPLEDQLGRLDSSIAELTTSLNETKNAASIFEEKRRSAWDDLKKVDSRLEVLAELKKRFFLLNEQYQSDINRLQAIDESGSLLSEINFEYCPVCGAPSSAHNPDHQECKINTQDIVQASKAELERIYNLSKDLRITQQDIEIEINELNDKRTSISDDLKDSSNKLNQSLVPCIKESINNLRHYQEQRNHIRHSIDMKKQLNEYDNLLSQIRIKSSVKIENPEYAKLSNQYIEKFVKEVETRLKKWNFPGLDRVTFDSDSWDIVISGELRSSHGKGVRAVTHAGFIISLLNYCRNNNLPHSGNVVIDSPLIVYTQPDVGEEGFSKDVKASFYYDLSNNPDNCQIIIIENESPPDDLFTNESVNIIPFTKTSTGRYGFIPIKLSV